MHERSISRPISNHLRAHRRSHQGIDLANYLIAATVDVHDAVLATLNVKHFPLFEGLRPAY